MNHLIFCYERRRFLQEGASWVFALTATNRVLAEQATALDVAYAGSMGSMMEGSVRSAVATKLHLEMHGRPQGSSALAQLIASGSIRPDVFIPITAGPIKTVLQSGKAGSATPVARTEMVIAYSPKSRFATKLAAAAHGEEDWWRILQEPELRFGRTDPVADPQGRNIIFTMMLAAQLYKQPELLERVLGPTVNPKQISEEPNLQARLQSGELDAASAYKIQPGPFHLPFVKLPKAINLSGERVAADHPDVTLSLSGRTYRPEPLNYYAAILRDAPHPQAANTFVEWLKGDEGQAIFRNFNYDSPGDASTLRA